MAEVNQMLKLVKMVAVVTLVVEARVSLEVVEVKALVMAVVVSLEVGA